MKRLVVVSNRIAPIGKEASAGGLAVGLKAALQARGGLWFGWSGRVKDEPGEVQLTDADGTSYATIDLNAEDYDEYYGGYANRTLWPLFHYRVDLAVFDRRYYQGYQRVNALFARHLRPLLAPGDVVWVHDYHLMPFGEELRALGSSAPLGFFLHTPFPVPEVLTTLFNHKRLVRHLLAYDVVGFQTPGDLKAFEEHVLDELGGKVSEGTAEAYGRRVRTGVFPIGIDCANFADLAVSSGAQRVAERARRSLVRSQDMIIGVDRLDYSKGLPERLIAFGDLLETYPENRGRVTFLQIATPSRGDVPEYGDIRQQLDEVSGRINGRFGELDWVPIRYVNRSYSRLTLAALFRTSTIALVTPLRDGMNLVAKEYVAAQDADDPGVLVLSRFAGAAHQLSGALIVNPYDTMEVAAAIQSGLSMPLTERRTRWSSMMEGLRRDDVQAWQERFLASLELAAGG